MKKLVYLILLLTCVTLNVSAADLIVQEFGPPTTYGSIGAAIAAASSGDRIIVNNRAGNTPWFGDITIDKSLSIISAQEDASFKIDGNITINKVLNGEVTIIGAEIYNGKNITVTGGATLTDRSMKVNLIDCFQIGTTTEVDLESNGVESLVAGCEFHRLEVYYGDIFGNKLNELRYYNRSNAVRDSAYIIGNYISGSEAGTLNTIDGRAEMFFIKNNYFRNTSSSSSADVIYFGGIINSTPHAFFNNEVYGQARSSANQLVYIASGNVELINNILEFYSGTSSSSDPIYSTSASVNAFYNYIELSNNIVGVANVTNLAANATSPNQGSPAVVFTDTDLTRNNLGVKGGPYPMSNYFNTTSSNPASWTRLGGAARVFFLRNSFFIYQNTPFNINAYSFDK